MDWRYIRLERNSHAFICGLTGSGKTELAQWIIRDRFKKYSVTYDPKHSSTISKWEGQTYIYTWSELMRSRERRIVYRPSLKAYLKNGKLTNEAHDPDAQEEFFAYVFDRGRTRLVVDESSVLPGGSRPSYYLRMCLTQGRELGISCVCLTQRPVDIPLVMMSEARKIYFFRLHMEEDMRRLQQITGVLIERQQLLRKHQFFMYDYDYGSWPLPIILNLNFSRGPSSRYQVQSRLEGSMAYASSGARAS